MRAGLPACAAALLMAGALGGAASASPEAVAAATRALTQGSGSAQRAALGAAITTQEAALAAGRETQRAIAERKAAAQAALAGRNRAAFATLAALDRIARAPALAWFAHPAGPVAAARSAVLVGAAAPVLSAQAAMTRAELAALAVARRQGDALAAQQGALFAALQVLRIDLAQGRDSGRAQAQAEAALAALVAGSGVESAPSGRGDLQPARYPAPVVGAVELDASGLALTVRAPAYSVVRAPATVSLRYAGPGGGPGQTAILEPRPGVLWVLRGLDRIERLVGETLLAGEPIGALGGPPPVSDEFLIDVSASKETIPDQILYMEVVRDDERVSPAGWFALPNEGTDG